MTSAVMIPLLRKFSKTRSGCVRRLWATGLQIDTDETLGDVRQMVRHPTESEKQVVEKRGWRTVVFRVSDAEGTPHTRELRGVSGATGTGWRRVAHDSGTAQSVGVWEGGERSPLRVPREPVEKNAPPQWNQDTMWSWIRHEWICCLDWDKR